MRFFKEAENSFQNFSRLRVWWVIITTLYLLMPTSWYQQTAQLSGNTLLLILYVLLKTPLILALSAYNSKTNSATPHFLLSNCNMQLFPKLKKILWRAFRATLKFRKFKGVFIRSCCCYGNLLCHENNTNLFTIDWAVFWYHDCSINW